MIIINRALARLEAAGTPIRVAVIGAGFQGAAIVRQIVTATRGMRVVGVANCNLDPARKAFSGIVTSTKYRPFRKVFTGRGGRLSHWNRTWRHPADWQERAVCRLDVTMPAEPIQAKQDGSSQIKGGCRAVVGQFEFICRSARILALRTRSVSKATHASPAAHRSI